MTAQTKLAVLRVIFVASWGSANLRLLWFAQNLPHQGRMEMVPRSNSPFLLLDLSFLSAGITQMSAHLNITIIKSIFHAACVSALLVSGIGSITPEAIGANMATNALIKVQYINPRSFTDFSIHDRNIQYSASLLTGEITRTLEPIMKSRFPGSTLTLQFTNIDLAGSGSVGTKSVRIVRTHTPARLSFNYLLADQSGRPLSSGSQSLVDNSNFGRTGYTTRTGPVSTEIRMLQNWLKRLPVAR